MSIEDYLEDEVEGYIREARSLSNEISKTLGAKDEALEAKNFGEAYRLSGLVCLLSTQAEILDRRMWVLMNPEEADEQATE